MVETSAGFVPAEVEELTKECIEATMQSTSYDQNQVDKWTSQVVEATLTQLSKLNKPFKYIVNCIIMQKTGAGLHVASSCFWDNTTDGSCTVRWENKSMYCVVSIFACAI